MWLKAIKKMTRRSLTRRSILILLVATSGLAGVGITLAVAAATVPTPTITAQPANPTNQTSAHFTYADSQAGVTYQCQLDTGALATCPSTGISYPGPLAQGTHTFKVQASASGGKTSSAASYTWTVDTSAPALTLSFPLSGGLYRAAAWNAGCSAGAGICGGASDPSGVASVTVSVLQQSTGRYWSGSSFSSTTEVFNTASGTTSWRMALALPAPDGSYTVHVRSTDALGNATVPASQLSSVFTIDTTAPPAPSVTSGPEATTTEKEPKFTFKDAEAGVSFLCSLDGAAYSSCTSPATYEVGAQGQHTFAVEARDAAGNVSGASSYSWTVIKSGEPKSFTITGSLSELLAPGVSRALVLTISNPNNQQIFVTSLTVSVQPGSTKAGCDGPTNIQVTQANASSTNTVAVAANSHATLPVGAVTAPQVLMKNLPTSQDACRGASFTFTYSGIAHS
jgi:hypothetical protein